MGWGADKVQTLKYCSDGLEEGRSVPCHCSHSSEKKTKKNNQPKAKGLSPFIYIKAGTEVIISSFDHAQLRPLVLVTTTMTILNMIIEWDQTCCALSVMIEDG